MRVRNKQNNLEVTAVVGTSAVILSFDMPEQQTEGLLGFAIEREDKTEDEKYFLRGFKYFEETKGLEDPNQLFSSFEHPIQSFMWEDFTIKENHNYIYNVIPVYGTPKKLIHKKGCSIEFTIPDSHTGEHSVYFNRGVAGSIAYGRKFLNKKPNDAEMSEEEIQEALTWLSKGLDTRIIEFIDSAKDSTFSLRASFYEFEYLPVLEAFKEAYEERGVDVEIIYDARGEKADNNLAIHEAGLPRNILIPRAAEADKSFISHNKFIILLKNNVPIQVWTGSTNITIKGIFGQCNVGHIVRNKDIALKYLAYWDCLKLDPLNNVIDTQTLTIQDDLPFNQIPNGMTAFFSPRHRKDILKTYAELIANSKSLVCGMFPFSFSSKMKEEITKDTDFLKYIIIDKKTKHTNLTTNDIDNVIVHATNLDKGLYDWLEETHAGYLFNEKSPGAGTNFVHNKVILIDPLSDDPIVITGSANFSDNSIINNDENTLVIRGNKDVTDMYFTEFVRIFNHYYVRSTALKMSSNNSNTVNPIILKTKSADWVPSFYTNGKLKYKRKLMFSSMNC